MADLLPGTKIEMVEIQKSERPNALKELKRCLAGGIQIRIGGLVIFKHADESIYRAGRASAYSDFEKLSDAIASTVRTVERERGLGK